ncbi:MAG: dihydroorotase, partial [Chitinophagaceae bacterium]
IQIHPLGAISKNIEGKDLAEMYDMHHSGAIAFTDGNLPIQSAGLMLKALQYVKAFDGTLIQVPVDTKMSAFGLMNEGIVSTQLGLPGIPYLSEVLLIKRDIDLVKYTDSKLHITGVATAEGIELIAKAKKQGLKITCSVSPMHIMFCDEDLTTYDTNLKLFPPLRSRTDMMALRDAIENNVVDCIASHHTPHNWDSKVCEFEYAKHGSIALQTSFLQLQQVLPTISSEKIANLLVNNATNIFNLKPTPIDVNAVANLTVFSSEGSTDITEANNKSKSKNTALFNISLKGKVIATITKNTVHLQS